MTILIGMLRERGTPGPIATAMALAATAQGADLIFFRPGDVDLTQRRIRARRFQGDGWQDCESRFPDVIENDDRSALAPHTAVWAALTGAAPFTTRRLGGKREMSRRLAGHPGLAPLMIPQSLPQSDTDLDRGLAEFGTAILKPVYGSQGRGIWKLHRGDEGVEVRSSGDAAPFRAAHSQGLLERLTGGKPFLLQKFIDSRLPGGNPFDIRLHLRRDGRAEWQKIKIYARIGLPEAITSNVATGGSVGEALPLLRHRYGSEAPQVMRRLEDLAREVPGQVQSLYPRFRIDALGVDLGLDESGQPWLFEINSFPGAKYFETADAVPRIGWCLYLARQAASA